MHRRIFGIAEVDLANMSYDLTPVGPADANMLPMMTTPDRKLGYTVAIHGTHGDRVTEFWVFDMATKKDHQSAPVSWPYPPELRHDCRWHAS